MPVRDAYAIRASRVAAATSLAAVGSGGASSVSVTGVTLAETAPSVHA